MLGGGGVDDAERIVVLMVVVVVLVVVVVVVVQSSSDVPYGHGVDAPLHARPNCWVAVFSATATATSYYFPV
jgi:hypothetical protein